MSKKDNEPGEVPEWLASKFTKSFNTLHGTDYSFKIFGKNAFIDMELRIGDETKEEIEHTKADPETLQEHTNRIDSEISQTLKSIIDNSGINEKFILTVQTVPENLTNNRDARIQSVENLWAYLEKRIVRLRVGGINNHKFHYDELKEACGETIADTFRVTVDFIDKIGKGIVLGPGIAVTTSENELSALVLGAVERKATKASSNRERLECYSNPTKLILLVELGIKSPSEPQDIINIIDALRNRSFIFKEIWIGSGSMSDAVLVWPTQNLHRR